MLLPDPDGPTIAVDVYGLMVKLTLLKTSREFTGAVGYLNDTFSNIIPSSIQILFEDSEGTSGLRMRGTLSMTSNTSLPTTRALIIAGSIGKT